MSSHPQASTPQPQGVPSPGRQEWVSGQLPQPAGAPPKGPISASPQHRLAKPRSTEMGRNKEEKEAGAASVGPAAGVAAVPCEPLCRGPSCFCHWINQQPAQLPQSPCRFHQCLSHRWSLWQVLNPSLLPTHSQIPHCQTPGSIPAATLDAHGWPHYCAYAWGQPHQLCPGTPPPTWTSTHASAGVHMPVATSCILGKAPKLCGPHSWLWVWVWHYFQSLASATEHMHNEPLCCACAPARPWLEPHEQPSLPCTYPWGRPWSPGVPTNNQGFHSYLQA